MNRELGYIYIHSQLLPLLNLQRKLALNFAHNEHNLAVKL